MKLIKNNSRPLLAILLMLMAAMHSVEAQEEENYMKLSEKLIALRGQVNDLSSELQQSREEHKVEMRGLLSQKNAAEANIKLESDAIAALQDDLLNNKKLIREVGADKDSIKEVLLIEAERLRTYVTSGIPFKVEDRLRSIEKYKNNLNADVLSSHKAANTLWSMIEDELKLTRSNGMYRQSIQLDGKEHLSHVVKLGMVMMYFRVGDDYGVFRKNGKSWIAESRQDSKSVEQIENLFAAVEKQIHVGYFELPNTL